MEMKQTLYPICCAHMLSQADSELVFRTPSGKLCKFKSNLKLILELLKKSIGTISAEEIAHIIEREMHIPAATVNDAIDDLVVCEILMDSREQFLKYHALTYNPPRFPSVLSLAEIEELTQTTPDYVAKEPAAIYEDTNALSPPVFDVLSKRHSCRSFRDIPVEKEKLFAICKAAYSFQIRPTASAGTLFPLSIYFINRIVSGQLPAGLYQYDPQEERLLLLDISVCLEQLAYLLNDAECVFGAPCIFFVGADIRRHMIKYANSGYRYVLLEAGHSLQNMTIAAQELGLGGVEYGGFCDEAVRRLFQMPEHMVPLACYALGYEDTECRRDEIFLKKEREKRIIERIVHIKELDINFFLPDVEPFELSNRRVVVSKFKDAHGRTEFGTGIDPVYGRAYLKAVMETYERYTISCRYFDRLERADKQKENYLHPAAYIPYTDTQIAGNGLTKFCNEDTIEWLQGYDLEGRNVYVPADLCFNVPGGNGTLYHVANTSGCAAHFDIKAAEQAALLELIERDALMKSWFYKQEPCRIREDSLPDDVRQRFWQYQEKGISVLIVSLLCDYAYVVFVCSISDIGPPYFVSGVAASFSSVKEAVRKAFDEWEASYILGVSAEKTIAPEEVVTPKDHGTLYRYTNCNSEIDYLRHGIEIDSSDINAGKCGNVRELSPVFVRYRSLIEGAFVVRAFSKELIPINFGFGMDFYSHSKIDKSLLKNNGFPHFFS